MTMLEEIEREKQLIARCERSLALEKMKKRRADTRQKIEFGGLVIKSGMDTFNKSIILGALDYVFSLMMKNPTFIQQFQAMGDQIFLKDLTDHSSSNKRLLGSK